jgi:tetratricopeptide (TPR) repeat protein
LDECISLLERIVQGSPLHSLCRVTAASNLLEALQLRYQAAGHIVDLDRAVELVPIVLAARDKKDAYASMHLHDAGNTFLSRFEVTGALEDLDRATEFFSDSVEQCNGNVYESHERLLAYAKALRVRYEVLHEKESMTKALQLYELTINSLPDTHPDRAQALCGLTRAQLCEKLNQHDTAEALNTLLVILNNRYCPAHRRLKDVSDALTHMTTHMRSLEHENALLLCTVYSTAIGLLPQVASFGLEPRVRLSVLAGAGALTTQGAIHAISFSQFGLALEMLEAGRTVFWTQGLHLRRSFEDLPRAISDRLTKITYAIARPMPDGLDEPTIDRELAHRRQLGDEFKSMLNAARLIPGFESLLLNASFKSIAQAAARHPIVVLVADETSGYAIIVQGEAQCQLVTLPNAPANVLQALSHQLGNHSTQVRLSRGMRKVTVQNTRPGGVYRELWTSVMHPIVTALQWPVSLLIVLLCCDSTEICFAASKGAQAPSADLVPNGCLHAATTACCRHLLGERPVIMLGLFRIVVHAIRCCASSCTTID